MHVTSRIMRVTGGQMAEAMSLVDYTVGLLNGNLGAEFRASVMVGGDPTVINATGFWESMDQYETFRAAAREDRELGTALSLGSHLFADEMEETMWRVLSPPGDSERYAIITGAQLRLDQFAAATAFVMEAAEAVSGVTGKPVGVATAMTGDISRVLWVGYAPDLATIEANGEALASSGVYAEVFEKGADSVVPGTLESDIWENVTNV